MADRDPAELLRENAYLKLRDAQLRSDILDLSAEVERLRGIQDRLHIRATVRKPEMATGGELSSFGQHLSQKDSAMSDITPVLAPAASVVGKSIIGDDLMAYGITRVPSDYFHFGGYRYTSLRDAVAQARRQSNVP